MQLRVDYDAIMSCRRGKCRVCRRRYQPTREGAHYMKIFRTSVRRLADVLFTISAVMLGCTTLLTFINSVFRRFFSFSLIWSEELCTYSIAVALFLGICYLELRDEQLCIGLLSNIVKSKKILKTLFILRGIVTAAISFVIGWYGITSAQAAASNQLQTFILRWPLAAFYYITVVSFWLAVISWITIFLNKGEKLVW